MPAQLKPQLPRPRAFVTFSSSSSFATSSSSLLPHDPFQRAWNTNIFYCLYSCPDIGGVIYNVGTFVTLLVNRDAKAFLAPQLNKRKSRFNGAPHSGIFDRRISWIARVFGCSNGFQIKNISNQYSAFQIVLLIFKAVDCNLFVLWFFLSAKYWQALLMLFVLIWQFLSISWQLQHQGRRNIFFSWYQLHVHVMGVGISNFRLGSCIWVIKKIVKSVV